MTKKTKKKIMEQKKQTSECEKYRWRKCEENKRKNAKQKKKSMVHHVHTEYTALCLYVNGGIED